MAEMMIKAATVNAVALSPDGKLLVSGSDDNTLLLWEVASGRLLGTVKTHSDPVLSVAFTPDGRAIASGGWDANVNLLEVANGQVLRILRRDFRSVSAIAFSPEGQVIASSGWNHQTRLWESEVKREFDTLKVQSKVHPDYIPTVAFSPYGKWFASGSRDTIKLVEAASGREVSIPAGQRGFIGSAAFSPDEKLLAIGGADIALWDTASGQKLKTLKGHKSYKVINRTPQAMGTLIDDSRNSIYELVGTVSSITFSPDGKLLATGSRDEITIKLWEVATGRELRTLSAQKDQISALAFSPDGKLMASGSWDRTIKVWDVVTGRQLYSCDSHTGKISSLTFSLDGRLLVSCSEDKTIKLWEVATGREWRTLNGHTSPVVGASFIAGEEKLVSGSSDNMIKIWDVAAGRLLASSFTLGDDGWVVVTPDGRFDTNQLDAIKELHWVLPEEPMRALPLEIFMRDYYEPRLLERVLSGESLPPAPSLPNLNRVQPLIRITGVKPQESSSSSPSDSHNAGNQRR